MMRSVQPIGMIRHFLFSDIGPSWLKFDGVTEYARATYPEFVARAKGLPWFLAGTTASTFKLIKVPAGTATVASGFDTDAGTIIGSDKVTLGIGNLPAHDHAYTDASVTMAAGKSGLLAGVLPIVTGSTPSSADKTTGKAGKATPDPVPIQPPGFTANLFVFAGRPRA
ncbi:hypothetical protein [Aureimonas sp. Leaf454]|uniref:hypothetical protein n=1 Tax=Aureimonas sp. Leaf454 TaxID=1736381 RepID=UPI001FCD9DCF|nr:hypothetical protein [Aureimonas sp. Leaf454]